MEQIMQFLSIQIMGVALYAFFGALLAILCGFIGKKLVDFIMGRLTKKAAKNQYVFDDILLASLTQPLGWAIVAAGVYVASLIVQLPVEPVNIQRFADAALNGVIAVLIVWVAVRLLDRGCEYWLQKTDKSESKLDDQIVPIIRRSGKVFLVFIGVILVLQNLGYSVSSLLAGLGFGGVAMALASKDTVANLFGSIVIFLDRPFMVGDWVEMDGLEGTVEDVTLRTTRIRTFANSLITVPNSKFTTSAINNWSLMKKRRIKMSLGVTYDATPEKMEAAVEKIREILRNDPKIHQDFFLVNFDNFGPSSLDIFIYCFTITTNWAEFLDARQQLNLKIMRAIHNLGLSFAFPSQSLYVEQLPGEPPALTAQRPQ